MRELLLPLLLVCLVLAIPIVPFLLGGEALEQQVQGWLQEQTHPAAFAAGVVVLLGSDILLPIPSSAVCTLAGHVLGFWLATAASWLGMTAGSLMGFVLARTLGHRAVERWSSAEAMARIEDLAQRYGRQVLVIARPVPVLAEASVLFLGTAGLPWSQLWAPLLLSNLGIALVYSALGHWVQLPVALAASIVLPLAATLIARRFCGAREV